MNARSSMTSPRPLDKDLYAIRHRAQELSKAIAKLDHQLISSAHDWSTVLNQCSVISSQLINIQLDMERHKIGQQLNKFTLQPAHSHFDCASIGIRKMPQIMQESQKLYADKSNRFIQHYDESELLHKLTSYNKMLATLHHFNSIQIARTKIAHGDHEQKKDLNAMMMMDGNEHDEDDDDIQMKSKHNQNEKEKEKEKKNEMETEREKWQRKQEKYLVEFMFCGQTPEQRARIASEESSDDDGFH